MQDYATVTADASLENDVRLLVRLAIAEDFDDAIDWTSVCLIDDDLSGACEVVPRVGGVCAGLAALPWIIDEFDVDLEIDRFLEDGDAMQPGKAIARLAGNARDLLACERIVLNVLSRTCGVATMTQTYVQELKPYKAKIYDTRKTTPGWRLLEKYAVACGGGSNHRRGLYDGFLIKDNHLQLGGESGVAMSTADAAAKALRWRGGQVERLTAPSVVEIEVDSLDQLRDVLPVGPDIVLIDNFSIAATEDAVRMRDELNPKVELEASGNVTIATIGAIAATGVDRISSGALTHQATWLDMGFDCCDESAP